MGWWATGHWEMEQETRRHGRDGQEGGWDSTCLPSSIGGPQATLGTFHLTLITDYRLPTTDYRLL
ncbi:MAG: hypothetical protein AVDCRST_MAG18-5216 [uncultured Thermomicrobiales bacterium]|uniref:Uncharacterized protein n=1 Tax=uncultured Thermomicrobiales bacterium TaxID=1645740 RepID=A0A6J4VX22_9BACT|nr:MAG: hypothetical protein AVDCRST_MAG18-5216 [uncultured Thermomicrobiales bacterium]